MEVQVLRCVPLSNVKLYPPFREYFRKSKPPLLAIWGKHDPFFVPACAEAYPRSKLTLRKSPSP